MGCMNSFDNGDLLLVLIILSCHLLAALCNDGVNGLKKRWVTEMVVNCAID